MATQEFRFDPSQILTPAVPSPLNRLDPCVLGVSLTITRGQALARKTSDNLFYPLNRGATDGTQTFAGFAQYSCTTDANGNVFLTSGGTAAGTAYFSVPSSYTNMYTGGIFDPRELTTAATGTPVAEIDTITPTNPTTGDIYSVFNAAGQGVEVTVGATQTATATVTLLKNAWNADPALTAIATASGTATFILTGVTKGTALGLTATAVGTGTVALVVTTAASGGAIAEKDTWTFAGTIATGDVYTATITAGGGQTQTVTYTVGATATAAAVDAGLIAAWNANGYAASLATASGTATFILTAVNAGQSLNVAITSSGAGTVSKVVTIAAGGNSIGDILPGAPGARVLASTGWWEIP